MRHLVLGVDGGGTKTDAVLADAGTGAVLARVRTRGANHERLGWDGAAAALAESLEAVLAAAGAGRGDVVASAWGLAGLDWPDDEVAYRQVVKGLGLASPTLVVNDAFLVLEAAPDAHVAVVAGTGMIAVGRRGSATSRTLGVGAGHGEWGSGGDIVRAAAEAVAQELLGLGPHTALTARALAAAGTRDVHEYCRLVWREDCPALLPPDVWAVAAAGDEAARAILDRAADSYAAAAECVSRALDVADPVIVLAGRVLDPGDQALLEAVTAAVCRRLPEARVRRLGRPPVDGAVEAARRLVRA